MEIDLRSLFDKSFSRFLAEERQNVVDDVHETNLCARLAGYLEHEARSIGLEGYYADTEYNRKQGGQLKTIINHKAEVISIRCDLILHSRGKQIKDDNLIAIEMKKSHHAEAEKNKDRARLYALTKQTYDDIWSNDGTTHPKHVCGYKLGIYIEFDARKSKVLLEEFRNGASIFADFRDF